MKFVLVTGCPRSGTSCTGQWLATSKQAHGLLETRRSIVMHAMLRESKRFACFDPTRPGNWSHGQRATTKDTARRAARDAYLTMFNFAADDPRVLIDKEPLEIVAFPQEDYVDYLTSVRDALDAKFVFMVRSPVPVVASMLRRQWGYSLTAGKPRDVSVETAVRTWRLAAHAALRLSVIEPERTMLVYYESLCGLPAVVSQAVRDFTGLPDLADFEPLLVPHEPSTALEHVPSETLWERRLLGYDERSPGAAGIVLLTGEPGAGKTTLAYAVEAVGAAVGRRVTVIDGDELRMNLWPDLGYSAAAREESVARAYRLAVRVAAAGTLVILAMVAPAESARAAGAVSARVAGIPHAVVRVNTPAATRAIRRPPQVGFVNVPYEEPPEALIIDGTAKVRESAAKVIALATRSTAL